MIAKILSRSLEIKNILRAQKLQGRGKIKEFLSKHMLDPKKIDYYLNLKIDPNHPFVITNKDKDVFLLSFTESNHLQFKKIGTHEFESGAKFQDELNKQLTKLLNP